MGVVVMAFPSVCVLEKLLALVTDVPDPLLWVTPGTVGPSQGAARHCGRSGLSLGFPAHQFNVCSFRQAQPLVRLLLHSRLFLPVLHWLLLAVSCSRSFLITGPFWGPLLLEAVLRKTCPFLFFLYYLKEIKKQRCVLLLWTRIWSACVWK